MKLSVYIFLFLLSLSGLSCQNNTTEVYPAFDQSSEVDTAWNNTLSEKITIEELPVTIKEGIHNDELFHDLDISNITKITKDDLTYYDMTFRDGDGQLIMVFYDEKGEIIVP